MLDLSRPDHRRGLAMIPAGSRLLPCRPLPPIIGLHAAARRFCMQRRAAWFEREAELLRLGRTREWRYRTPTAEYLEIAPGTAVLRETFHALGFIDPAGLSDLESPVSCSSFRGDRHG